MPTTDFDFASSNAKFDKAALGPGPSSAAKELSVDVSGEGSSHVDDVGDAPGENGKGKEKDQGVVTGAVNGGAKGSNGANSAPAYDRKLSFFDTLSSGSNAPTLVDGAGRGGGRGGRRGGGGRNRREEERERNVAGGAVQGGIGGGMSRDSCIERRDSAGAAGSLIVGRIGIVVIIFDYIVAG